MVPDFTLCLRTWNAKQPAETLDRDAPHRHIVAKMITVQLLASCFTPPQNINALTLPSGWYYKPFHQMNRFVSSLRQHAQWRHSPAYGHHARNNSTILLWQDQGRELSREDRLAEQTSQQQAQGKSQDMRDGRTDRFRSHGEPIHDESRRHRIFPLRYRRTGRTRRTGPSSSFFQPGRFGPAPTYQTLEDQGRRTAILRIIRGLRRRGARDNDLRLSLEPVLQSERQSFVQPVKEHMMKI